MDQNDFMRFMQSMHKQRDDEQFIKKRVLTQDEEKLWLECIKIAKIAISLENQARALRKKFWAEIELTEKMYCRMMVDKEKDEYCLFFDEGNDA